MYTARDYTIEVLAARQLNRSTIHSYLQTISHLGLSDVPMEEISLQYLYSALMKVDNPNTRRKHVIALRSIFQEFSWIKKLRIQKSVPRVYDLPSEQDIRFTLMLSPFELQGLLMMYAGLRCGEACDVKPSALKGQILYVHTQRYDDSSTAQAKTSGHVIIPQWLADRVKLMQYRVVTPGMVRESFRRYGRKTGIHISPHMLRHWYATMMVNHRINPEIARRQMRHSDLKTTLGYYTQVSLSDIEQVITDLFENDQ